MDHPAQRLKDPPWDRLTHAERAPYLREAREYLQADVHREGQPDVTAEELEDAIRQAAAEMYAETRERRASEQPKETPRAAISRDSGHRISL
jgi:RNase P/RNase MRP subunit POP5